LLTNHINSEEGKLFPIIDNTFSEDDWLQINSHIEEAEDPLFGDVVQEQFTDLYNRISSPGE
jgi:hemerythrin-like domain-containing protein